MILQEEMLYKFFTKQNCTQVTKYALRKLNNHLSNKFDEIFKHIFYICMTIDSKRVTKKIMSVCISYFHDNSEYGQNYDDHIFTKHDCGLLVDKYLHESLMMTYEAAIMLMSFVEVYCNKLVNFCCAVSNDIITANNVIAAIDIIEYNELKISSHEAFSGKLLMPLIQCIEPATSESVLTEMSVISADTSNENNFTPEVEREIQFVINRIYDMFVEYVDRLRVVFSGYDEYSLIKIATRYIFSESIGTTLDNDIFIQEELYTFEFHGDSDFLNSNVVKLIFCTFITNLFLLSSEDNKSNNKYDSKIGIKTLHKMLRNNINYMNVYKKSGIQIFIDRIRVNDDTEIYKSIPEQSHLDIFTSSKIESLDEDFNVLKLKSNFFDRVQIIDENERFLIIPSWVKDKIKNYIFTKVLLLNK